MRAFLGAAWSLAWLLVVVWLLVVLTRRRWGRGGPGRRMRPRLVIDGAELTPREAREMVALKDQARGVLDHVALGGGGVRQRVRRIERKRLKILAKAKGRAA